MTKRDYMIQPWAQDHVFLNDQVRFCGLKSLGFRAFWREHSGKEGPRQKASCLVRGPSAKPSTWSAQVVSAFVAFFITVLLLTRCSMLQYLLLLFATSRYFSFSSFPPGLSMSLLHLTTFRTELQALAELTSPKASPAVEECEVCIMFVRSSVRPCFKPLHLAYTSISTAFLDWESSQRSAMSWRSSSRSAGWNLGTIRERRRFEDDLKLRSLSCIFTSCLDGLEMSQTCSSYWQELPQKNFGPHPLTTLGLQLLRVLQRPIWMHHRTSLKALMAVKAAHREAFNAQIRQLPALEKAIFATAVPGVCVRNLPGVQRIVKQQPFWNCLGWK